MKTKQKHILIALVVAVVVGMVVKSYVDDIAGEYKNQKRKEVAIAKSNIKAGSPVLKNDIEFRRIPEKFLPQTVITRDELEQFQGQEVSVDIAQGDYVLESYFTMRQVVGTRLSEQIQGEGENLRAVTLPVDETNSMSRSIVAGDHVDIILTFSIPKVPQKIAVLLLQNVKVIVTGAYSVIEQERGEGREKRYNSLTLRLPMKDALRLNYARQVGNVSVLLRHNKDESLVDIPPIVGIGDVLTPLDKEKIEEFAAKAMSFESPQTDQLREQLRDIFEKQRKQTQGPAKP